MKVIVLTRWTNGRIREYAIETPDRDLLTDVDGNVLRFHQKRAALYCLDLSLRSLPV